MKMYKQQILVKLGCRDRDISSFVSIQRQKLWDVIKHILYQTLKTFVLKRLNMYFFQPLMKTEFLQTCTRNGIIYSLKILFIYV